MVKNIFPEKSSGLFTLLLSACVYPAFSFADRNWNTMGQK
jgi:hypothetical protein